MKVSAGPGRRRLSICMINASDSALENMVMHMPPHSQRNHVKERRAEMLQSYAPAQMMYSKQMRTKNSGPHSRTK